MNLVKTFNFTDENWWETTERGSMLESKAPTHEKGKATVRERVRVDTRRGRPRDCVMKTGSSAAFTGHREKGALRSRSRDPCTDWDRGRSSCQTGKGTSRVSPGASTTPQSTHRSYRRHRSSSAALSAVARPETHHFTPALLKEVQWC